MTQEKEEDQVDDFAEYLGDAVYVRFDGFSIILTTENRIIVTNRIILEPEVYDHLLRWWDGVKSKLKENPK